MVTWCTAQLEENLYLVDSNARYIIDLAHLSRVSCRESSGFSGPQRARSKGFCTRTADVITKHTLAMERNPAVRACLRACPLPYGVVSTANYVHDGPE